MNPKEGVHLEFYITGNPYVEFDVTRSPPSAVTGRIYGGNIIKGTDDDLLTGY